MLCVHFDSVHPLDCSSIVKTPKGLQVLARARAWRVVLDVSEQILQTRLALTTSWPLALIWRVPTRF